MSRTWWNGPYRYSEMLFAEQNAALEINSPLSADYERGALYLINSETGDVKIWRRPADSDQP